MKKTDRLKKRSDFLYTQKSGKKWVAKGFVLQIADRREDCLNGKPHFGITASRRLSKKAVVRNRVRRRLRALAYDILPLYARPDVNYVLIGRQESLSRSYEDLQKDLKWCLRRLGYDCEKPGAFV